MSKQKYFSLEQNYNDVIKKAVEECILCGECLNKCLTYPLSPLKDKAPEDMMEEMIAFLKDGVFTDDVYLRAFGCAGCGDCSDSCPQEIDPLLLHEALKIELLRQGKEPPEVMNFVIPGQRMNLYEILSSIQMKPSEARWLKKAPENPQKTENLVFLGCSPVALPDKVFHFLDVLERMGIDFVAMAGGELCCGTSLCPAAGKVKESEEMARELIDNIKAFSPERVILFCNGCYRQFTEFFPSFLEMDLEVQHYTQFFLDNLEKLKFTKPLNKKVFLYESCMTRRTKLSDPAKALLEVIPGVELVDPELGEEETLCCGGIANMTNPPLGQQVGKVLIDNILKTTADYIANTCSFCRLSFYPYEKQYSFNVRDIATLLDEAMEGKEYEDKMTTYWNCESVDVIIEKSRENFESNGYKVEEMKHILPMIFHLPA
ncbi:(Fe-S)-binding protein [Thermodesulfobacteriota bacterium]